LSITLETNRVSLFIAKKQRSDYETRLFINGEFVNSTSGKTFPCVNPTTEEIICQVQEAGEEDVNKAVAAAKAAFAMNSEWRTLPSSKRRDLMLKLAELIDRDRAQLAEIESLDNGKPLGADGKTYGSFTDLHLVIQCLRYCESPFAPLPPQKTPPSSELTTTLSRCWPCR
jgi:acyl-CoA reductase-like NAD-dependent aldehyde dehydrogenase